MARVIVADDEEIVRDVYKTIIGQLVTGVEIEAVSDGESLVDRVRSANAEGIKLDLILTDYQMPGMDGLKAISQIRIFNKNTPIYVVSGMREIAEEALKLGATGYIKKGSERFTEKLGEVIIKYLAK